eukprot:2900171-Amphidinium_carterae.1
MAANLRSDLRERVDLRCGDMFQTHWSQGSILLVNSTGFDDELMQRVANKLAECSTGTRVITLSQPLVTGHTAHRRLSCFHQALYKMTWGNATAFVYEVCET